MAMQLEIDNKLIPRPYQQEMTQWLWDVRRGINTDHPGLGKTLETAEAVELPALISCPKHLVGQWSDFLRAQYGGVVAECSGTPLNRDRELSKKADWYVINHQMLHRYHLPVNIRTFIGDEAQHLRSRNAHQSRAAFEYVNNILDNPRVYLVTANPAWKSVDDIWHLLYMMYPKIIPPYHRFVSLFMMTDTSSYGTRVIGIRRSMRRELERLINPVKFGRTYKDVGRQLPTTIESVVTIDFPPAMRKLYDDARESYRLSHTNEDGEVTRIDLGSAALMHTLRQFTAFDGKIDAIKQIIEDNQKMTLVGTWYRETASLIYKALGPDNAVMINGDTDARERASLARQARLMGKHVVATEASLTEGVDLSTFRQVIFAEEPYAPGHSYQFLSRVVRDRNNGEVDPVLIYYVHVKGTVDQQIHRTVTKRGNSMKELIREVLA